MKHIRLKNRLMLIQCSALIFSLSAVFTSVYAWYTSNRKTELQVNQISTETGMTATLKYFTGNGSGTAKIGYETEEITSSTVTYASGAGYYFDTVTENDQTPFNILHYSPKHRYSFAIEVTSGFSYLSYVRLKLTSFISAASAVDVRSADGKGIQLAEAIRVYGACFNYGTETENNTAASAFVKASEVTSVTGNGESTVVTGELFNRFAFNYGMTPSDSATGTYAVDQDLAAGLLGPSYPASSKKIVFLFTVEFSNDQSTFYTKDTTNSTSSVNSWIRSTSGNSNAYMTLTDTKSFELGSLSIVRGMTQDIFTEPMNGESATRLDNANASVTLPAAPAYTGFTFGGWYSPEKKQNFAAAATYAKPIPTESDQTCAPFFYALWTANS
jgi:hypothetical protein